MPVLLKFVDMLHPAHVDMDMDVHMDMIMDIRCTEIRQWTGQHTLVHEWQGCRLAPHSPRR